MRDYNYRRRELLSRAAREARRRECRAARGMPGRLSGRPILAAHIGDWGCGTGWMEVVAGYCQVAAAGWLGAEIQGICPLDARVPFFKVAIHI